MRGDSTLRLHEIIAAVCPIDGVSVGVDGDSSSVTFIPHPGATAPQIAAGQGVVLSFDWSDNAQSAWLDSKEPLLSDLKTQAAAGIAAIDTYLTIADTATAVQVRAEVKAIDQRQRKIIQALNRLLGILGR